jgi:hypothetical protein
MVVIAVVAFDSLYVYAYGLQCVTTFLIPAYVLIRLSTTTHMPTALLYPVWHLAPSLVSIRRRAYLYVRLMAVHLPHLSMKLTNYLTIDLTSTHLSGPVRFTLS